MRRLPLLTLTVIYWTTEGFPPLYVAASGTGTRTG